MRTNTYDAATRTITIEPIRAAAIRANFAHYADVFSQGRTAYAIPAGAVTDTDRLHKLSAFFFWSAWSATTNRPDDRITYTHNWPYEPLVGNRPTGETVVWTGVSIIMLLAGISAMVWWYASRTEEAEIADVPQTDPLGAWTSTPSQQATIKYFWVVAALILVQMLLGVVTAHYGVEGNGFYGIPLSKWLPYSVARTWHVQMGLFWIATAWLAAGLFIGPLVSEREPAGQRAGCEYPVPGTAGGRGRFADGRMAERSQPAVRCDVVLLRPSGLRIRRPGTRLATGIVRGLAALAGPDDPGPASRLATNRRAEAVSGAAGRGELRPSPCFTEPV